MQSLFTCRGLHRAVRMPETHGEPLQLVAYAWGSYWLSTGSYPCQGTETRIFGQQLLVS